MKKSFMTRALAMGLSMAMAFSLSAATNVSVASAAAKPAMKSTKMTLKVGQSKNYQATAATQKAYKISGVKLSTAGKTKVDVKVNSSKKSIKVTGKAVTKSTNVVITFKNNSTKKSTKVTTKAVVKANVPTLTSVKQETGTKLTATLATAVEKVDLADVALVRDESHSVIAVKSVTVDTADATKLNIETYVSMTDGKSYTLTYTAQDEAKTQSTATFTATDGKIASFALTPETIPANKATTIKYRALDANSVVIYEKPINDKGEGIDIDVATDNGYMDDAKLTLYEVGNTAKVTVSYHTYNYDAQGNETGLVKNEFTVTAVDSSVAVSGVKYTIVNDDTTIPAWENLTANTRLAMNDNNKYARFQIKDSNGDDITADSEYTVESSNDNIVLASGVANGAVSLVPVKEGSAYLVLKDKDKTVTTLAITVVSARTLATFTLDKTSVVIATDAAAKSVGAVSIGYSAKDQYGEDIEVTVSEPARSNSTTSNGVTPAVTPNGAKGTITLSTSNATTGTYTYNVTASAGEVTRTRTFSVNVKKPNNTSTYEMLFVKGTDSDGANATKTLDTTVTKDSSAGTNISVNLVKRSNGVISDAAGSVRLKSIIVRGSNGTKYADTTPTDATKVVSSAAVTKSAIENFDQKTTDANGKVIEINAVSYDTDTFTKNLPAGSYTVTLKFIDANDNNKEKTITGTFKVEDKQPTLTATVLKTNADTGNTIHGVLADKDFVKYVYGGVTQGTDSTPISVTTVYGRHNGKTVVVSKATVKVALGNSKYVNIDVPVNRVFTNTSDWAGDIEKP